jgi:hypothetical protein
MLFKNCGARQQEVGQTAVIPCARKKRFWTAGVLHKLPVVEVA